MCVCVCWELEPKQTCDGLVSLQIIIIAGLARDETRPGLIEIGLARRARHFRAGRLERLYDDGKSSRAATTIN